MIDHDAYDAAERQRDRQIRQEVLADQDAAFLESLFELFDTRGAAYVSENLHRIERSFPPGFLRRHIRVEHWRKPYQRVILRADLAEAA